LAFRKRLATRMFSGGACELPTVVPEPHEVLPLLEVEVQPADDEFIATFLMPTSTLAAARKRKQLITLRT
jgi:hypothetical protein